MPAHGHCHSLNLGVKSSSSFPCTYLNECVNVPVVGNMAFSCNKEREKQLEEIVFALFLLLRAVNVPFCECYVLAAAFI